MLYSFKKETGRKRIKDKHKSKKKKYEIAHTPCPLTHTLIWINHPTYIPSTIIHNNYTMDTEFQVQMRQYNKCGSVQNDEIFNLHLGSGTSPRVSIRCLLQDTNHIYWFHRPKQLTRKKTTTQKWDSTSNKWNPTALAYILRTQG